MESKRVALVTGCGLGGIGHALVLQLRQQNFVVVATVLPFEAREHLQDPNIICVNCDVTNEKNVVELSDTVRNINFGQLNVLINNAGICYTMTAVDTETSEVEKMFAVNVFGPMRMVRVFHKMIVKAKGTIVNIGSVGGIVPYIYGASYNASKAALHHYGNTLRAEMKPFGVQVINIISGEVGTNILKRDKECRRTLPEDSIFGPLREQFEAHITRTPTTITPDQYACRVVKEIAKSQPVAWLWYGPTTSIVRWCDLILPRTFWDLLFWRMFEMDKLATP